MRKYLPLLKYLRRQSAAELVLSFEQIEDILAASLPASAYSASWWSSEKLGFWPPQAKAQQPTIVASLVPGANRVRFRRAPVTASGTARQSEPALRGDAV